MEKVKKNLVDVSGTIGVGVSGGADSVSLFLALCEIFGKREFNSEQMTGQIDQISVQSGLNGKNVNSKQDVLSAKSTPIVVVTVNHHVRSDDETNGDMLFVIDLVEKYKRDFNVQLVVFDLDKGQVQLEAEKRKCGIEEAARFLRYECFERAIRENGIDYFCLAHNQNDNLETILMRFLQGAVAIGIPKSRGKYIRPLIDITRKEIEDFLNCSGQEWRTDSTNFDDSYFRNNVRLNLIPLLDEKFPGWKNAVLSGTERVKIDNEFIAMASKKVFEDAGIGDGISFDGITIDDGEDKNDNGISFANENTISKIALPPDSFTCDAISYRVLIQALNEVGVTERIPHQFLHDVILEIKKSIALEKSFSKRFSNAEVCYENHNVFVKKYEKKQTDFGFFDIIYKEGIYDFPFGMLSVTKSSKKGFLDFFANGESVTYEIVFPIVVRSPAIGEKKRLFIVEGGSKKWGF